MINKQPMTNEIETIRSTAAIGVDLGGSFIKIGLISSKGRILQFKEEPTPEGGPETILQGILTLILTFVKEYSNEYEILGVGIGLPGVVQFKEGFVINPPNMPGWKSFNVLQFFKSKLDLPVFIDNDANVMALAEAVWGAGKDCRQIVCLTLGTGVGGGIVIDKELYHGASGGAGELGHVIVQAGGRQCGCGNKGCLEAYLGANYIIAHTVELLDSYPASILNKIYSESAELTPPDILEAVKADDPLGMKIVDEMAYYLGIGIGSIINVFNPDMVIIGGGLCNFGEYLLGPARKVAEECAMEGLFEDVKIVQAEFKNRAGVIGAGSLVFGKNEYRMSIND
ncbi:ROK family protein [bacterium]|nr:ROK family protein [bacterium]